MAYDVIVIGAGLNGLVTALALGGSYLRDPLRIAVVDQRDPRAFASQSHDSRGTALTPATQTMLRNLGLWPALESHCQAMSRISVTDGAIPSTTHRGAGLLPELLFFDVASDQASLIVENASLFQALVAAVVASPSILLQTGQGVADVSFAPGLASVHLTDGQALRAALVVGADGRASRVREAAAIAIDRHDYQQSAVTLSFDHTAPHHGRAEEHFTPQGVFAVLPLPGNRSSVVWAEDSSEAQRLMALDDGGFRAVLSAALQGSRGAVTHVGQRHAYPLSILLAETFVAERCALVGDAAHVIHPLAGLGGNLGFKDAAALAACVGDAAALGLDIGGADVLDRYQRWRRFDTMVAAAGVHGLSNLFNTDFPPLQTLRRAGLTFINGTPALKTLLMHEASGMTGDVPPLMRA